MCLAIFHYSIHLDSVAYANSSRIAEAIENFNLNNGRYPFTIDELGIDSVKALHDFGLYYHVYNNTPGLVYDATFSVGDYWIYNFSTHQWLYVSP